MEKQALTDLLKRAGQVEFTRDRVLEHAYGLMGKEIGTDPEKIKEFSDLVGETFTIISKKFEDEKIPLYKGLIILDTLVGFVCDKTAKESKEAMTAAAIGTSH